MSARDDPRPAVQAIADLSWRAGGFLLENCHVVMHTVGRTFAREAGVSPATLMDYLPRSNDPGCSAGFAHGLVTGAAPKLDVSEPAEAAEACADAGTRYQRYSCVHGFGHAFMRIYDDRLGPALKLCMALGRDTAPDCAQGAYHDYWFAVKGADNAKPPADPKTNPRELCGAQPSAFVRPCWYRAFVEVRPQGFQLEAPRDLEDLCADLRGVQRGGCITGAAVIGPADPAAQLGSAPGSRPRKTLPAACAARRCRTCWTRRHVSTLSADRRVRTLRRDAARVLLPLDGEGARGRHGRPLHARGLPEAVGRGRTARMPGGRAHDGRGARDL